MNVMQNKMCRKYPICCLLIRFIVSIFHSLTVLIYYFFTQRYACEFFSHLISQHLLSAVFYPREYFRSH
jgi:hypothetical protein